MRRILFEALVVYLLAGAWWAAAWVLVALLVALWHAVERYGAGIVAMNDALADMDRDAEVERPLTAEHPERAKGIGDHYRVDYIDRPSNRLQ